MKKINNKKINYTTSKSNLPIKSKSQLTHSVQTAISAGSRATVGCCNLIIFTPIRTLLYIPVSVAQKVQQNLFPSFLFTQGYRVLRTNFGFTREKMVNDILLVGMVSCMVSKFWINPYFDKTQKQLNAQWLQADNTTIPEADYETEFYTKLGSFFLSLGAKLTMDVLNKCFKSLLKQAILFKNHSEFVLELLSNYSAYDLHSGRETDKDNANINLVRLFEDIKNQSAIISLWNSRINTTIDLVTALYALTIMSPPMVVSLYITSIILPKFVVLSLAYSTSLNVFLKTIEKPMVYFFEKMNRFNDRIVRQITNIDANAELIMFLDGENFERKKLIDLIDGQRKQALNFNFMNAAKYGMRELVAYTEWLLPIVMLMKNVRNGTIEKQSIITFSRHSSLISKFFNWSNKNLKKIEKMESSERRNNAFKKHCERSKVKRIEIAKKVTNSEVIQFSGSVYSDATHKTLLAQGTFTLPNGSITHIKGDTGCGKTVLFRILRSAWNHFDGQCSLPKEQVAFLPSQAYILDPEEPLFQTICYPKKFEAQNEQHKANIIIAKSLLQELQLKEHIYDNLVKLSHIKDEKSQVHRGIKFNASLSDGERKRVAFCYMLQKLQNEKIKFLILDEPFKGVDFATQAIMVRLLKNAIQKGNSAGCTVLFSNHEQNHGFNTHTLNINKDTKEYKLSKDRA